MKTLKCINRDVKFIARNFILLACMLVAACQPQEKAPLLLDTPENAVRTLSAICADQDIEGALALYESTARQAIADRIADMRQKAEEAGGITQKQQDRIALAGCRKSNLYGSTVDII